MERLIHRAVTALGLGVSEDDIRNNLTASGECTNVDAELAIIAAKMWIKKGHLEDGSEDNSSAADSEERN